MNKILMSLDLEDARQQSSDGMKYPSRVVSNTEKFLDFLENRKWVCTFFTVGNIFRDHPDIIQLIKNKGHELAWHSNEHQPVLNMSEESFYRDLMIGKELGMKFGVDMRGYRAPVFSVNSKIKWFYKTLKKADFSYSSSVLPTSNPLYGWPGFGEKPIFQDQILEVPMRLVDLKILKFPFGGVYLRVFPTFVFNLAIKKNKDEIITTYLHPYDFDVEQERYFHGGINESTFYNYLMYLNRDLMLKKLDKLVSYCDDKTLSYNSYFIERKEELLGIGINGPS